MNQVCSILDSRKPLSSMFTYDEEANRESFHAFARYLHSRGIEMNDAVWHLVEETNELDSRLSFEAFTNFACRRGAQEWHQMP